jgi:hypothetical protein
MRRRGLLGAGLAAGLTGLSAPARAQAPARCAGPLYLTIDTGWSREAERVAAAQKAIQTRWIGGAIIAAGVGIGFALLKLPVVCRPRLTKRKLSHLKNQKAAPSQDRAAFLYHILPALYEAHI